MLNLWNSSGGLSGLVTSASFWLPLSDAGAGAVDLTLARGTGPATYTNTSVIRTTVDRNGLIIPVSSGVARSYYDPTTLQYMGYLAEGARTNAALQSILPGGGAAPTGWTQPIATGTSAPVTSVYGNADGAVAYLQSATAERPFFNQSVNVVTATTYCFSIFVESVAGAITAQLLLAVAPGTATPTVTYPECEANPSGGPGGAVNVGRLFVTYTVSGNGATGVRFGVGCPGAATGSAQVSRPQHEIGSFPSTYIPTTTVAVTRNADVLTYPSAGNAGVAGTVYAECTTTLTNNSSIVQISDGTTNNRINTLIGPTRIGSVFVADAGVTQANFSTANFYAGAIAKLASTYGANNFAVCLDGGTVATDVAGTVPAAFTTIGVGNQLGASQPFGTVKNVRIWQTQFTDAQLQAITAG